MSGVLIPKYARPTHVTLGDDGIPDYITAVRSDPRRYVAPPGMRLVVLHNNHRLRFVTEANRKEGWAVGFHYAEKDDGKTVLNPTDSNGIAQHRFYEGRIAFHLERVR